MLRRNGKPRSCEPCRISKIRCDHTTPTCTKCQNRGITDQCFYHDAPMTKPVGTPRKKPEPRRRRAEARFGEVQAPRNHGVLSSLALSPPTLRNDTGTVPVSNSWSTPSATTTTQAETDSEPVRSFYLGSTSYASVFTEERPLPDAVHEQPRERINITPSSSAQNMGTRHCQFGIGHSIVSQLAPFSFFEKSVHMYFSTRMASALVGPLILSALPQLRDDLELLKAAGSNPYPMYAEMIRNTIRPLRVPSTMLPSEFFTLFTGTNLRWESLGLVLAIAGYNAQFIPPNDSFFTLDDGTKIDRDVFIEDIIHTTNDCINLCQTHGAVNDIMVWLIYINAHVVNHGTWKRLSDTVSALYAAGMHCEGGYSATNSEPMFLRESRRRTYSAVYRSDKMMAVFFGRPPLMAWRYSDRKQILDVADDIIAADDPNIVKEALSKLDSAGWNTEGHMYSATLIRLRCQHAIFKERLLEQSLAGEKDSEVVRNLRIISAECTQFWETLPAHLRYEMYDEDGAWSGLGPATTLRLITVYLEYLHMHFQMQRLLHRQTQDALPALLEVSLKLLTTSLVITKPNNGIYEIRRHFPTVILFYCFPAAGMLALELRRCTIDGVPLPNTVSRADVIRKLSVLTSCLEGIVLPGDGNHKLCSELNKMLALVLDEVLNYQPPANSGQGNAGVMAGSAPGPGFFDLPMIEGMEPIPTEAEDFLNWLDNADWGNTVRLLGKPRYEE
ncbi:hypothetical protein P153DRAFT_331434 [Dothidotthia symphoricarpi CBS 119687]|uniref:Zn(2)-C6 fungal-type domain-containing protein n=1 Tax=Dothidotthia symphoricarpi CBS 119687 TaxID=1392245 RepID=A0A6A6ASY6_9PLEO|nr:uncharacterized protein P153DRAFT_331434 [Dothidotthia symphoricarpi CBS 119687]KAF2134333.1 hypothetical protein P153DRAFT_331434 [Dothidotthia symphoricarpi CBS 119687]